VSALKVCPQCGTEYPANARFCEIDGTALRSAAGGTDLIGTIVADRYHILKKLGEGGMGQVYLAEHVKMGRKSALKVMHPGMKSDVDAVSRFNREAANASRIAHPNVAAVYDFGETPDGIIYLAMEFIDGPPLTSVVELQGALPPQRAADIVRQTAEALAVAHDMGIVHRDLKPDNIMIARTRDGRDLVKVVDFGIAKAAGNEAQKVTKTGLVVGTPEYMSPEQLSGDKLDGRSDIYSLALVAFNMLTGTLPFPSDSQQESMIMRLTDRPKSLTDMMPDRVWPADVQSVMDKALERDANARYQHATDFGMALYNAIQRMPEGTPVATADAGAATVVAIPPTRVSSAAMGRDAVAADALPAAASVSDAATVVVTPKNFDASVGPGTAPEKKSSKIGLYATAAGVVLAGAIAAKLFLGGPQPRAADSTSPRDTSAAKVVNAGVPTTGTEFSKVDSTQKIDPLTGRSSSVPEGSAAAQKSSQTVSEQLSALVTDSRDPSKGSDVLRKLAVLEPRVQTSREWFSFGTLKANVANAKGDDEGACAALKAIQSKLDRGDLANLQDRLPTYPNCVLPE
jgi:serine/threonine-protein kinase